MQLKAYRAGCVWLQAGVDLVFASDWPVVQSSPLQGVQAAANRKLPGPQQVLNAAEAVSAEQALLASTIKAAEMAGLQDSLGSIRCALQAVRLSDGMPFPRTSRLI